MEIVRGLENQAELQMACYQAATALAVATASEAKVQALQNKADENMAGMADDFLEYQKLAREAGIKQEITTISPSRSSRPKSSRPWNPWIFR